jgi:hypothetical protein
MEAELLYNCWFVVSGEDQNTQFVLALLEKLMGLELV